ncbi:MAG: GreA/GreB family elongation factor [Lentisphaeria bacterium]|nr:GreA/GreB family elongation factor [Lentisphaeria bacterium]
MSDWQELIEQPEKIEECFLAAADNAPGQLAKLNALTRRITPNLFAKWPGPVRQAWMNGSDVFIDTIGAVDDTPEVITWLLQTAQCGYDSPLFRDALATGTRAAFPNYLDPAGIISALGVHDPAVSTRQIHNRWRRFELLEQGRHCCHAAYGAGIVDEVDPLTSEVRVTFDRLQVLPLDVFLDTVQMVKSDSVLENILTGHYGKALLDKSNLLPELVASLVPPKGNSRFFKRCLVPAFMTEKVYAKAVAAGAVATVAKGKTDDTTRTVADARSPHELVGVLNALKEAPFGEAEIANVNRLLTMCSAKADQAELMRDIVVRVWSLAPNASWLVEGLKTDLADAAAFKDEERFIRLTDELSGKAVVAWLSASATALDPDTFFTLAVRLPLRLLTAVEQAIGDLGLDKQYLIDAVTHGLRTAGTCDMALWLWRSTCPEKKALRDITLVMKALAVPVKGSFLRANRDLRKILVTDSKFHTFLVEGRSVESSRALVRAVEHSAVLDNGERQSMLVRLVRSFPELRSIIEKRGGPVKKKAIQQMTSIRSYETRRLELEEIIQVKIPENSRAIAVAREHGDLRENAEFKAAKDEQAYLTARRNELEAGLDNIRAVEFSAVQAKQVIPGSMFDLRQEDGSSTTYCLLGLWDSDPSRNLLSYETPLGAAVLSAKEGEKVDLPDGGVAEVRNIAPLPDDILTWLNHFES